MRRNAEAQAELIIAELKGSIDKARRLTASDPQNQWCRQATILLDYALSGNAQGDIRWNKCISAADELVASRTAWLEQHGVPISMEFVRFANAIGDAVDLLRVAALPSAPKLNGAEGLVTALTNLRSEVRGAFRIADYEIATAIGFTNVRCINNRLAEAERALVEYRTIGVPPEEEMKDGWISVAERLPTKFTEYLVAETGDTEASTADFYDGKWKTVRSFGQDYEERELYDVQYWRELPAPPVPAQTTPIAQNNEQKGGAN